MPSSLAHGSVAVLLSPLLGRVQIEKHVLLATAAAAALPDVDAIGRPFGRGDLTALGGHRASTHSLWFALACGGFAFALAGRTSVRSQPWRLAFYVFLVVLSHGILDAFTTYGDGVAFLAPVSIARWKSGWQPISGLLPEILLIWLPAFLVFHLWTRNRLPPRASSRHPAFRS